MGKLLSVFDVLRKGSAVADPALLKNQGGLALVLTAFLWSVCTAAEAFGYAVPITKEDAATMAGAIAIVVGLFVNYASSDKVGILPAKPVQPEVPSISGGDTVRAEPEPSAATNAVEQHEQQYPRDQGGGG